MTQNEQLGQTIGDHPGSMGGASIGAGGSYPPLFYTVGVKGVHKLITTRGPIQ